LPPNTPPATLNAANALFPNASSASLRLRSRFTASNADVATSNACCGSTPTRVRASDRAPRARDFDDARAPASADDADRARESDECILARLTVTRAMTEDAPEDAWLDYPPYYTRQTREATWKTQCDLWGRAVRRYVERQRRARDGRARWTVD
jgi:hypothetical protein